jgi:hypothetical protein
MVHQLCSSKCLAHSSNRVTVEVHKKKERKKGKKERKEERKKKKRHPIG